MINVSIRYFNSPLRVKRDYEIPLFNISIRLL